MPSKTTESYTAAQVTLISSMIGVILMRHLMEELLPAENDTGSSRWPTVPSIGAVAVPMGQLPAYPVIMNLPAPLTWGKQVKAISVICPSSK